MKKFLKNIVKLKISTLKDFRFGTFPSISGSGSGSGYTFYRPPCFVPFRYIHFASSFCVHFILFRSVPFRFGTFRYVSFRFVPFRYISFRVLFRILQVPIFLRNFWKQIINSRYDWEGHAIHLILFSCKCSSVL